MDDVGNHHMSSYFIDAGDEAIIVPDRGDIGPFEPEVYLKRLDAIQSPSERLKEFLVSIFYQTDLPTYETTFVRSLAFYGAVSGCIYGGILRQPDLTKEYTRKFNMASFEGKGHARSHITDFYIYNVAGRGFKHAIYGGLLCGSVGTIVFSSIVYRSRLYYPDWAIGFTTLGALTRFWSLGLRGAIGGAGLGLIGGTIGYGVGKLYEFGTGTSVSEARFYEHSSFIEYQRAKRENEHERQSYAFREKLRK